MKVRLLIGENKMTIDEAVKKIAREGYISIEHAEELYDEIIPKPVVPQYVADWYEKHKDNFEEYLFQCIHDVVDFNNRDEVKDFKAWLSQAYENGAIKTLVNMHQFGYEVEKEKRYTVRIRSLDDEATYLNYDNFRKTWVFYSRDNTDRFRTIHTRKELEEAGFGWVFDCEGVEVKEVE
ncbi:gp178 [Streptococcus phage Sfi11]|uniref:Gp178 n=1 Tax=Streptococcus phage Sfi11 TaxID=2681625 RepID=Q9MCI0_9CAUD|nr:gp178 [Streptococcus phage Sfi11]AAF63066.1 gp178 [Streptococcus phage Sfi11]